MNTFIKNIGTLFDIRLYFTFRQLLWQTSVTQPNVNVTILRHASYFTSKVKAVYQGRNMAATSKKVFEVFVSKVPWTLAGSEYIKHFKWPCVCRGGGISVCWLLQTECSLPSLGPRHPYRQSLFVSRSYDVTKQLAFESQWSAFQCDMHFIHPPTYTQLSVNVATLHRAETTQSKLYCPSHVDQIIEALDRIC